MLQQNDVVIVIEPYPTLFKLVIWDYKAQKYKLILNKNGKMTNQYHGRIFVEKLSRRPSGAPRYIPMSNLRQINWIQDLIAELRAENERLKKENETLKETNKENEVLKKENDKLKKENDKLTEENANLLTQNQNL
ncbi:32469_t:CDS:2 [Gigaspora margarita]|uniref:32469_t:CDS:1 n=1 Tax=Gigaspora margarita TaxID=4874 RepID=A0ABN7VS77_GIGMA|nr:32469_t:CDS:2 [Gigaspora margarita]